MRTKMFKNFPDSSMQQVGEFNNRHPQQTALRGIVCLCSVPALVSLATFAFLSVVVFFSVQSSLAGITCITLLVLIGPICIACVTLAISCYIAMKASLSFYELLKYLLAIPAQNLEKAIKAIINFRYSGHQHLYLVARPNNSTGSSRTFPELKSRPIAVTVAHQLVKIANNNRNNN